MPQYVYSTATNSITYVTYEDNPRSDISVEKKWPNGKPMRVTIQGGHGIANKHFITPRGIVTKVSDEEFEMLMSNDNFKRHVNAGFITYDKKNIDPIKKVVNMNEKDGSAPLTPKDFQESELSSNDSKIYKAKNNHLAQGM